MLFLVIFGRLESLKNSSLERRCFDSELMHSNHHSQLEPRIFFKMFNKEHPKHPTTNTYFQRRFDLHQLQGATIRVTTAIESCSVYWSHIGHQLLGPALPLRIHHEGWSKQSIRIYPHPGGVTPKIRKRKMILSTKPSPSTKKETNLMQQVLFQNDC